MPAHPTSHTTDQQGRTTAEAINRTRARWLVIWGCYTRRFWAYPLFAMRPRMIIHAGFPDALIARMDEAEHRYRIPPSTPGSDQR